MASISNHDMSDQEYHSPKHGRLLTMKAAIAYKTTMKIMAFQLGKYFAGPLDGDTRYHGFLTKDEFKQMLRNECFVRDALENETMMLNWVPIRLKTEQDRAYAAKPKNQHVLLEGSMEDPISLSVFTCPLPIQGGKIRSILDYFTCQPDNSSKASIVEHLAKHVIHYNNNNNVSEKENEMMLDLEFFTDEKYLKKIQDDMGRAGFRNNQQVNIGLQKRHFLNMGVFLKDL